MAIEVEDIKTLRLYLSGVLDRADHHAHDVNEIVLAVAGGIIWKATGDICVRQQEGEMKNVLWLRVDQERTLCFAYNHNSGNIEVRDGTVQGEVIIEFNNSTPLSDIKNFFKDV